MEDIVSAMWSAQNNTGALGKVIAGLNVLCTRYETLWLIVEGKQPDLVKAKDVGLSLGGITIGGRLLVPFSNVKPWDLDCGEPCVSFEMAGEMAMFAPAQAPDDDRFAKNVERFLSNDWYHGDIVYLSDLAGPVGKREGNKPIDLRRHKSLIDAHPDMTVRILEDELVVHGEVMVLGDITWFDAEQDGDGNRYAHLVLKDGRYRRLALGDLGR